MEIASAIIAMARSLHLEVVAEGPLPALSIAPLLSTDRPRSKVGSRA
jgi:hypothetical protein